MSWLSKAAHGVGSVLKKAAPIVGTLAGTALGGPLGGALGASLGGAISKGKMDPKSMLLDGALGYVGGSSSLGSSLGTKLAGKLTGVPIVGKLATNQVAAHALDGAKLPGVGTILSAGGKALPSVTGGAAGGMANAAAGAAAKGGLGGILQGVTGGQGLSGAIGNAADWALHNPDAVLGGLSMYGSYKAGQHANAASQQGVDLAQQAYNDAAPFRSYAAGQLGNTPDLSWMTQDTGNPYGRPLPVPRRVYGRG